MRDELAALEVRKTQLTQALAGAAPSPVHLHPRLPELHRKKVARLEQELNCPELRAEAAEPLRGLVDEIRLIPENGRLEIELVGNLPSLLLFASENPRRIAPTGCK
jgi:site-specific DNA recombinase